MTLMKSVPLELSNLSALALEISRYISGTCVPLRPSDALLSLPSLSLDIDVIDPSLAPASELVCLRTGRAQCLTVQSVAGTPEPAGWTPREMHRILRGLTGLNFV